MTRGIFKHGADPCDHCRKHPDNEEKTMLTVEEIYTHCRRPHTCTAHVQRESDGSN